MSNKVEGLSPVEYYRKWDAVADELPAPFAEVLRICDDARIAGLVVEEKATLLQRHVEYILRGGR